MNSTNKQITTLLCSLAFVFCFADGLSAQTITAKTKSGYESRIAFIDVVGESLQFENEEGEEVTLPLKDFEKATLIEIVVRNEKENGTYGLDWDAYEEFPDRPDDDDADREQALTKFAKLTIGSKEDSYKLLMVVGVKGRKLQFDRGLGMRIGSKPSSEADGDSVEERPLREFDEPSLILIATRFINLAKENEKAAEMAKQAELEAAKREEERKKALDTVEQRKMKRAEDDKNFIPKTRFDHCVVTVQNKVVEIPGSNPVDYQAVKTRTLINDDGTTEDLGSYSLEVGRSDPSPDWLDQLGSSGWELVQVSHEKNRKELLTSTFYFKREK